MLLQDDVIKLAWIRENTNIGGKSQAILGNSTRNDDFSGAVITLDREDEEDNEDFISSFEIDPQQVEEVKKRCVVLDYPLMEEYDFRQDTINANLDIDLSPKTGIIPYLVNH